MKRRRLLITGVLLLLLGGGGAIVNVAVAWGLAIYGPKQVYGGFTKPERVSSTRHWKIEIFNRFGSKFITTVPAEASSASVGNVTAPPAWSYAATSPRGQDVSNGRFVSEEARGWPMLSLYGRNVYDPAWPRTADDGRWITSWPRMEQRHPFDIVVLPCRPIYVGFAINTIFYAAILWGGWVVWFVPGMVRRRSRRRRGLCPACAYPVGTSAVCTECGAAVKQKAETQKAEFG